MRQSPDYWIEKMKDPGRVLGDAAWVAEFNRRAIDIDPNLADITGYPESVAGEDLRSVIEAVSHTGDEDLYYRDDPGTRRLESADFERYRESIALDRIDENVPVRFGLVLHRTNMRRWPTRDFVIRSRETRDLDRFQENALFPGEAVAVLHESDDGEWVFVRSYNYHAWIRKIRVAEGSRRDVSEYVRKEPFLVVTGARANTNYSPSEERLSELQLDMGARLPLTDPENMPTHVDGQNPLSSFAVQMPVAGDRARLDFRTVLVGRGQDVREGYLDYTRENVIRQAFKFLGERYGWGHSYNARDCTGLVLDVYRSMGILLPRNSGQQAKSPIGRTIRFGPEQDRESRLEALSGANVGDLVYAPGHVMIFLGFDEGEPWVVHHMSGSGWVDDKGEPIDGIMNGVAATALTKTEIAPGKTYFDEMTAIKTIH